MIRDEDAPLNFIRFGLSRKKEFLRDTRKLFNGLVVPANILLYQYKSTPSIIYRTEQPFVVDPMSYLFGQPYETFKKRVKKGVGYEFKPSFRKLMENHGLSVDDFINVRHEKLISLLLKNQSDRELFVQNSLSFQRNTVGECLEKASKDMEEDYINEKTEKPMFLIPPYLLWDNNNDIIRLNLDIARFACDMKIDPPVYPMIFIEKSHLVNNSTFDMLEDWISLNPKGFCLWINDFKEIEANVHEIQGLIKLIKLLSGNKKRDVFMLFGGYFSLLLYHFGLSAISHGTSFSESRWVKASVQKGSGPAPIRYYIRDLHRFFSLDDAIRVLYKRDDLLCDCLVCRQIVKGNPENIARFQTEKEELAEIHFLYNRYQEKQEIGKATIKDLRDYLKFTYDNNSKDLITLEKEYRTNHGFKKRPLVDLSYLEHWKEGIENFVQL